MPVLPNARRELFAQELAKGTPQAEAYEKAGYKRDKSNACTWAAKPEIVARVAELLKEAADKNGVTIERIVAELAKIGFANMADYMKVGSDGDPYLDFGALTRDQAAALQEVTVEDFKDGRGEDARDVRRVKFKLADKRAALVDLGRHLGMFKDKVEHSGPGGTPLVPVLNVTIGKPKS